MDEQIKRIHGWFEGTYAGPYKIQIQPTNRCNLDCLTCSARGKANCDFREEVAEKRYLELIDEADMLDVQHIDICGGGEPLVRASTILAIMQKIKNNGIGGTLVTNGTLLSKNLIKKIVKLRWDDLIISLDGPNKRINDALRGEGTFDKVVHTIGWFNYFKKKIGNKNPIIKIASVVCKKNYAYLDNFVDLSTKLKIYEILLQPIVIQTEWGKKLMLDKKDIIFFKKILSAFKKKLAATNIRSNAESIDPYMLENSNNIINIIKKDYKKNKRITQNVSCFYPWLMAAFRADGAAGLCPSSAGFVINSNIKDKSLRNIWYGKGFNNYRTNVLKKNVMLPCQSCGSMEIITQRDIVRKLKLHTIY